MILTSINLSIILILLGITTLSLSIWAFNKRELHSALEFSLFMFSVAIYAFGYALEISRTDIEGILKAIKFEYTGIPYISYFAVLFSYRYTSGKPLNRLLTNIMLIIPVTSTLLAYSVEYHTLLYINPHVDMNDFFPTLDFEKGIFYIIRIVYQQLISLICIIYLIFNLNKVSKVKRLQLWALIMAQLIPWIILIIYVCGFIPGNIDINPFSSFVVGIIFSIAILKLKLFKLIPFGRDIAIDSVDEAFILIDKKRVVLDFNSAATSLEFIHLERGHKLSSFTDFSKSLHQSIDENLQNFDFSYTSNSMDIFYYKVNIYNFKSSFNRDIGRVILINNVTDIKKLMKELEHRASYDYLTRLNNRRSIMELGSREVSICYRSKKPLSFIMVDIDRFKDINDTYGHKIGDQILILVSKSLKENLRDIDIIGRYGGEEFLIICPNTTEDEGFNTAERLRESIDNLNIKIEDNLINTTISLGLYTFNVDNEERLEKLIDRSDKALYRAKNSGRNRVSK